MSVTETLEKVKLLNRKTSSTNNVKTISHLLNHFIPFGVTRRIHNIGTQDVKIKCKIIRPNYIKTQVNMSET